MLLYAVTLSAAVSLSPPVALPSAAQLLPGTAAAGGGFSIDVLPTLWSRFAFNEHTPPPPPFGPNDCAAVSLSPLLSSFECDLLRSAAAEDGPGWLCDTTDRYGTDASALPARFPIDRSLEAARDAHALLTDVFLPRWLPMVHELFAFDDERVPSLRLAFARILKYDASLGHVALGYHCDGPLVTLGVALNDADEYDGGGTVIAPLQERDLLERERKRGIRLRDVGGGAARRSRCPPATPSSTRAACGTRARRSTAARAGCSSATSKPQRPGTASNHDRTACDCGRREYGRTTMCMCA